MVYLGLFVVCCRWLLGWWFCFGELRDCLLVCVLLSGVRCYCGIMMGISFCFRDL